MSSQEYPKTASGEKASKPMRETFFRGLTVCAIVAFLASLLISFALEDSSCRREIKREINSKIAENNEYLQSIESTARLFKNANVGVASVSALTAIHLVKNDPSILAPNSTRLAEFAKDQRFSEIVFVSSEGIVDGSWPKDYTGINVRQDESLKELKEALDAPIPRVAPKVDVRLDLENRDASELVVTAARIDKKGVVVIKLRDLLNLTARQVAVASHPLDETIGRSGRLCLFPDSNQDVPHPKLDAKQFKNFPDPASLPDNQTSIRFFNGRVNLLCKQKTPFGTFVGWIPYRDFFVSRMHELTLICFCNFIVLLAIFTLVHLFVQKQFVDSIYAINNSLYKITAGNLNEKVQVNASKEFVELSAGVNSTVDSLKEAADEVKRRTDEELTLAGKIQLASLPKLETIYTRHKIFDVYAKTELLAGVGGDMYDFFFIADNVVLFYVADVAGRGVAASLVMMRTMALVKNFALLGHDLSVIVTYVNRYLADSNESPFVSGIFFMLNLETGELKYVDAGHIPPIFRKKGEKFEPVELKRQLVLGLDPDQTYTNVVTTIAPGDDLILYTDGILGSGNTTLKDFFATSHALEKLDELPDGSSSQDNVKAFLNAVLENTDESRPSDDVSVLCFRFLAKKTEKTRRRQDSEEEPAPCYPEDKILSSLHSHR